jgi:hypothetical protein
MAALGAAADPAFLSRASGLLAEGNVDSADALARSVLDAAPDDADALVIEGTAVLYRQLVVRRSDSIFRPDADPAAAGTPSLTPSGAQAVASYWKRVPGLDASRSYLWGDLAQLTFRAGDAAGAVEFARSALTAEPPDAEALQAAAQVFLLNLDFPRGAQALARIPGNRSNLLYQGLEAWRTGKDGWRTPLKAFVDDPGADTAGSKLAAYLLGSAMRDTEAGYLEALKLEPGTPASLAVRLKYVDRYPNKFASRFDLGRSLNQFGSYSKALAQFDEIDRHQLTNLPEERQAVLFQQAWANQASGHPQEASRLWDMVSDSRDFYLRSAAAWFLGSNLAALGKTSDAKDWWLKVADEPARSKFAFWADAELKKLR